MQVKTRTGDSNDLIKDMQYKKILQLREKNVRHKLWSLNIFESTLFIIDSYTASANIVMIGEKTEITLHYIINYW